MTGIGDDFLQPRVIENRPAWSLELLPKGYISGDAPDPRKVLQVEHDLTDRDLRRFYCFDVLYDPRPFLGFIPQACYIYGLMFGMVSWVSSLFIEEWWLNLMVGAVFTGHALVRSFQKMTERRREAREAGLCLGRKVILSAEGVTVRIDGRPEAELFDLGEMRRPWSDFEAVEIQDDIILLWMEGRRRLVIPLRAFATASLAVEFATAAAGWVETAERPDPEDE